MAKSQTKKNPKFDALVALLGGEEAAKAALEVIEPKTEVDPRIAQLVAAGFTEDQAAQAVGLTKPGVSLVKETKAETAPLTSKETAEALVAQAGLVHIRGRVYSTTELIEAQVRVLKTGKAEVVRTPGNHHIKAVVVFRTDDGSAVAVQNLGEPN